MPGYQYRGEIRDVTPEPRQRPAKMTGFDPSACGTYAGYRRHQKWGVPYCQDCRTAMAAYSRDRYQPATPKTFTGEACGTWAGRRQHDYYGVPACEPCKAAARVYQAQWRARKRVAA